MSIFELAWSFAFIIGMPLLGFLIGRYGWQAPFPLITGLGVLSCFVIWAYIPNSLPEGNGKEGGLLSGLKDVSCLASCPRQPAAGISSSSLAMK